MKKNYILIENYTDDCQQVNGFKYNFDILGVFEDYNTALAFLKMEFEFQCAKEVDKKYIDNIENERNWDEYLENNEDEWVYTINYEDEAHIIGTIYMDGEEQYSIHLIEKEIKEKI